MSDGSDAKKGTRVFISHCASSNDELVKKLTDRLSEEGLTVFLSNEAPIGVGDDWERKITDMIGSASILLVLVDADAKPSDRWVSKEWSCIAKRMWESPSISGCQIVLDNATPRPFLSQWPLLRCSSRAKPLGSLAEDIVVFADNCRSYGQGKSTETNQLEHEIGWAIERYTTDRFKSLRKVLESIHRDEKSKPASSNEQKDDSK